MSSTTAAPVLETERRWLLRSAPDRPSAAGHRVLQAYAPDGSRVRESIELWPRPGVTTYERVRKERSEAHGDGAFLEHPVDGATGEELTSAMGDGAPAVSKIRLTYPSRGVLFQVDVLLLAGGRASGIVFMEAEVPDVAVDRAAAYAALLDQVPPFLLALVEREITGDRSWSNAAIAARTTRPERHAPVLVDPRWITKIVAP